MSMTCRYIQICTSNRSNLREQWGDTGAVAIETQKRPLYPHPCSLYCTSKRIDTCTKAQGSSLQGPGGRGVSEGVTGRTLRKGVLPGGNRSPEKISGEHGLRPPSAKTESWGALQVRGGDSYSGLAT